MNENEKSKLYQQYENAIRKQVYRQASKHMMLYAIDDLQQEASYAWLRALDKFDASKGNMIGFINTVVRNHLASTANRFALLGGWGVSEDWQAIPVVESAYEIADAKAIMTEDEQAVVDEALTREHKSVRSIVKRLREQGWSVNRARRACKGVKEKIVV